MITYSILNDFNMQKDKKMTIKEFEQSLLNCLNRMNNDKIKNKYEIEGAYGITIYGQSYWIPFVSPKK